MNRKRIEDAIEMLQWADTNCENIRTGGLRFISIVKLQIAGAIVILEAEVGGN